MKNLPKWLKVFWICFAVFMFSCWYYVFIMTVAVDYLEESNDIRMRGIMHQLRGEYSQADSCENIGQYLIGKYVETKKWIPKPFRSHDPKNYKP